MSAYATSCRPKLADLLQCVGLDVTYTRARGAHLYRITEDGREVRVLDLVGGFGAGLLGHNRAELRELIRAQLDAEVPFLAQSAQRREAGLLAARLNEVLPTRHRYMCHLSNTGAEAIEAALKHGYKVRLDAVRRQFDAIARDIEAFVREAERDRSGIEIPGAANDLGKFRDDLDAHNLGELERFQRAPVVLALKGSFHGKTATALKVTFNRTYREGFEGLSAVHPEFLDYDDVERLATIVGEHRLEFLRPRMADGRIVVERVTATTVIALCLEVIQGEGGIRPVPEPVLARLAEQHALLGVPCLIDEIQTGCGRTGTFVAFGDGPLASIDPEYITLSKALGGGLVKVAATLIRDDVYDPDFGILHTSTFAEDELSCTVARRVIDILTRDDGRLLREVKEKGDYLLDGLRRLQARFPRIIGDVRGKGLMIGVEFADLEDRSPLFRFGSRQGFLSLLVASYLLHHRDIRILAPLTTLLKGNPGRKRLSVLRIQPAVDITNAEMDDVLSALAEVCTIIDRNHEGVLVGHLIGIPAGAAERRDPPALPVVYPLRTHAAEFDARVGFVVHPAHTDQVLRYYFPSLIGRVDRGRFAAWWSRLSRFLEPDVIHTDHVRANGFVVQVNFVSVPYLPRDLAEAQRATREPADRAAALRLQEVQDRIQDAVTVARELGDDHIPTAIVGLGAFTSIVTDRGTTINDFEVPITTGNAYTAGLMLEAVRRAAALQNIELAHATAAVVGSAGNIGSVLAMMLAGEVGRLRLIGSGAADSVGRLLGTRYDCLLHVAGRICDQLRCGVPIDRVRVGGIGDRLVADLVGPAARTPDAALRTWLCGSCADAACLAGLLDAAIDRSGAPEANPYITVHVAVDAARDCDVITIATNSPASSLVSPELVRRGAIVASASVPSNLSTAFGDHLQEYFVFDGGYARLPEGQSIDIDCIGLPGNGLAFGCLAETILLGLEGQNRSFARGPITPAQVEEMLALAARHGFTLGDFKLNEALHPGPRPTGVAA